MKNEKKEKEEKSIKCNKDIQDYRWPRKVRKNTKYCERKEIKTWDWKTEVIEGEDKWYEWGWCAAMVSSRQGKSVARQQTAEVFTGAWTWGGSRDQLRLKLAWLLRSPKAFCRNICGRKTGEDWRSGSPPLGSFSCPPLQALLRLLWALSLLRSTAPPTHSDQPHAACSDIVTKSPTLV